MQFIYTFPAMTTALRRSAAQAALCMVKGSASATVKELSRFEAPVAASISIVRRDGGRDFRFYDGRVYVSVLGGISAAMRHIDGQIISAIGDALVEQRKHAAAIQPRSLRPFVWQLWSYGRNTLEPPSTYAAEMLPAAIFEDMKPFDARRHDEPQFEYWRTYADELVSQLILIDGEVWRPTPEPVLRWGVRGAWINWDYDDAGVFDLWKGRPKDLPKPYGQGGLPGFLGQFLGSKRYWLASNRFVSLPEADALASDYGVKGGFRLLMPEAFTVDIHKHEMNRAARLAVAAMKEAVDTSDENSFIRQDDDLAHHYRVLSKLTSGKNGYRGPEELEDALTAFVHYSQAKLASPYHNGSKFSGDASVGPMARDILARWNNREVSLDFVAGPTAPRP